MSGVILYLAGYLGYFAGTARPKDTSGTLSTKALMALAWPAHVVILLFVMLERAAPTKK